MNCRANENQERTLLFFSSLSATGQPVDFAGIAAVAINVRYEAPADLRDKPITIRFNRANPDRIIVFYKTQRMGQAKVLDLIANGQLKRCSRKPQGGSL